MISLSIRSFWRATILSSCLADTSFFLLWYLMVFYAFLLYSCNNGGNSFLASGVWAKEGSAVYLLDLFFFSSFPFVDISSYPSLIISSLEWSLSKVGGAYLKIYIAFSLIIGSTLVVEKRLNFDVIWEVLPSLDFPGLVFLRVQNYVKGSWASWLICIIAIASLYLI